MTPGTPQDQARAAAQAAVDAFLAEARQDVGHVGQVGGVGSDEEDATATMTEGGYIK